MEEQEYHDLLIRLDERTQRILEQTTKTNGRVNRLEERVDKLESKNDTSAGAKQVKKTFLEKSYQIGEKAALLIFGLWIGKVWK